jgi:hypothetical protein
VFYDKRQRRAVAFSVAFFLFSVYLFTYRGGFHSIDEVSMYAVTESLVKFGRLNTDQIAWAQWTTTQAEAQGFFGADGHVYSKKGVALSLAQAPLYWLALHLPGMGMLQTVSLLNAIVTAMTGLLIFMFVLRLGFSLVTSIGVALIFGLGSIAFVYAKYLFSEPLAGFLLLLAAYMLFAYRQEGGRRHLVIAGVAAGFAVLARANNLLLLPIFALYLLTNGRINEKGNDAPLPSCPPAPFLPLVVFILSVAPAGLVLLGYNAARSGNPLQTGYDLTLFSPNIVLGLYKLLFSPLRGLFVYSPVLLLSLPGWWQFRRRWPAEAWLFAGLVGVTVGLFATWSSGEGLSWGSRFLVPLVPFWVIVLAPLLEHGGRLMRVALFWLGGLSLGIQILGVSINPWVFLARLQSDFGGEFFLEHTTALYDFRHSQIIGQMQAWAVQNSDIAWWQPWGFDGAAFGAGLFLVLLSAWPLGFSRLGKTTEVVTTSHTYSLLRLGAFILVLPFLLSRYYATDRQFGTIDSDYAKALGLVAAQAAPHDHIVTIAERDYHVPMNRFKERIPIIGFAAQQWPPPETALPLLQAATQGENVWLITIGFQPAAPNNATERWLTHNTFKVSDEWLPGEVRLVRYSTRQPTAIRPLKAVLGAEIALVQANIVETARPGQTLSVELFWRPLQPPGDDYTLFLQLLTPDGQLAAQQDGPPGGGYAPTATWQPGQLIASRHALLLPPGLPHGDYRLIAGLYDPATGKRLGNQAGGDFVALGTVFLEN